MYLFPLVNGMKLTRRFSGGSNFLVGDLVLPLGGGRSWCRTIPFFWE